MYEQIVIHPELNKSLLDRSLFQLDLADIVRKIELQIYVGGGDVLVAVGYIPASRGQYFLFFNNIYLEPELEINIHSDDSVSIYLNFKFDPDVGLLSEDSPIHFSRNEKLVVYYGVEKYEN